MYSVYVYINKSHSGKLPVCHESTKKNLDLTVTSKTHEEFASGKISSSLDRHIQVDSYVRQHDVICCEFVGSTFPYDEGILHTAV